MATTWCIPHHLNRQNRTQDDFAGSEIWGQEHNHYNTYIYITCLSCRFPWNRSIDYLQMLVKWNQYQNPLISPIYTHYIMLLKSPHSSLIIHDIAQNSLVYENVLSWNCPFWLVISIEAHISYWSYWYKLVSQCSPSIDHQYVWSIILPQTIVIIMVH